MIGSVRYLNLLPIVTLAFVIGSAETAIAAESKNESVRLLLQTRLTKADLCQTKTALFHKLLALSNQTKQFEPFDDEDAQYVMPVKNGDHEWVLVVGNTGDDDTFGWAGLWLGLRGGRVAVRLLPSNDDDMVGPLYGEWRRSTQYLIGAGFDRSSHSPNFADGDIQVYKETAQGLSLKQREHIDLAKSPVYFPSKHSLNLVSLDGSSDLDGESNSEFKTLDEHKSDCPTRQINWTFRNGRYRKAAEFTRHDEWWAADRLATAVSRRDERTIKLMIPSARVRAKLLPLLRKVLRYERVGVNVESDSLFRIPSNTAPASVNLFSIPPYVESPWMLFEHVRGKWVVTGIDQGRKDD